LIFVLSLLVQLLSAQGTKLPEDLNFFITKPKQENLEERQQLFKSVDTIDLNEVDKWTYSLVKSSLLLYSDRDSSLFYFLKAHSYMPSTTCDIMRDLYKMEKDEFYIFKKGKTSFLTDLPNFNQEEYLNECNLKFPAEKEIEREKSELEMFIMERDQRERKKDSLDWKIQNHLDSLNQSYMDSLYQVHGSLAPFDKYEQDAFSYVIHHSPNCEWIYKWFEIWLVEKNKGNIKGGHLMGPAFKRMLDREKGYCCKVDSKKCNEFIDFLTKKFEKNSYYWIK